MKTETKYSNEPISFRVVEDFLPPPSNLIAKQETTKITISLNKSSIDFFKAKAKQHKTKYQKMIRQVLDEYSRIYAGS